METQDPRGEEVDAKGSAPPDPRTDIKDRLAKFLLSLIQAFLRTGYYTPDHPQAKKAKEGLYEDFQGLLNHKYELSFLVSQVPGGKKIVIEGMLPEPQELSAIMLRGMAEMYTPKFATFLERKDLVSLTLKAAMTWQEFNHFIDLISEPAFADTIEKSDKERFVKALKERGIFNISYIFNEELVLGEREIPWRSQVALSRLRKDFRTIPLYHDLDADGMRKVRRQIIQDVVRPMRSGEIVFPILMNSDLAQTEEFPAPDIDKVVIASLSDRLLLQVAQMFRKEASSGTPEDTLHGKRAGLARMLASSLRSRKISGRGEILEAFFSHGLISLEHLPRETRRRIKMRQDVEKFIARADDYLQKFDEIRDAEKYTRFARSLCHMLPELTRRDRYEEIRRFMEQLHRHFTERTERSVHAGRVLDEIAEGKALGALKAKFMSGNRVLCEAIAPIFSTMGKRSIPHLLPILEESDDQVVQKIACETLMHIDPSNLNLILNELSKEDFGTTSAVRIIRALGEIGESPGAQKASERLKHFLEHKEPRFREEALGAYYAIMGEKGETLYLSMIEDPDMGVQKKAILCLGRMKSRTGLEKFLRILEGMGDPPTEAEQKILPTLFGALAFYGDMERPGGGSLEDFLLQTLERHVSLGPLKFLKKKGILSDGAVAALCETLGKIGTLKSRSTLQKMEKQGNRVWKNRAAEALKAIVERVNVSQQDTTGEHASLTP